ncbi:MAG: CdaR family protein [Candidatus Berkelbacteria bacterium]|nr:CdaR family protein [Candidatus Berkelbacteria bacterium]
MIKFITKNYKIKLACLGAAAILWLFVSASQNSIAKLPGTIEIKPVNVGQNLVPQYDEKTVSIKVMAKSSDWQKLSSDSFTASIDMAGLSAGTHQVPVNVYTSISGVSVVEKSPSSILVTLEPVTTKQLPIHAKIQGSLAEGMAVQNVSFSPDTVSVKGAVNTLNDLDSVDGLLELNSEDSSFSRGAKLQASDADGKAIPNIEIAPASATAKVDVIHGANTKTVGIRANVTGLPKDSYFISNISVNPSVIDITGVGSALSAVKYIETAEISVANLDSTLEKDIILTMPDNILLLDSTKSKVHVSITIETNYISKQFDLSNFAVTSQGSYTITGYTPVAVQIICQGNSDKISSISPSDFVVSIDLTGKIPDSSGNISLKIDQSNFSLPSGIILKEVKTSTLLVRTK